MTGHFAEEHTAAVTPPRLSDEEINRLLDMRLIANLATIDDDGGIHLVPMWFRRDGDHILMPTSRYTSKYRNLSARPRASVMIDVSRSGLNLHGVLIRGPVEIIEGDSARALNRSIHLRYVIPEGLSLGAVVTYLREGDDVTLKIAMERMVTWDLTRSEAGHALAATGAFHELDV